jgi:hypothetical protein
MAGGLIQIASYGNQDILLISNPQITFFKIVYRRHTNFSMEYHKELFNGINNFGESLSITINKTGDLLHKLYLKIQLPDVLISNYYKKNNQTDINNILNSINILNNNYILYKTFQKILNKIMVDIINESLTYKSNLDGVKIIFDNIIRKYSYYNELNKVSNINISTNIQFFNLLSSDIIIPISINNSLTIKNYIDINKLFTYYYNNYKQIHINDDKDATKYLSSFNNFINDFKNHLKQIDKIFNIELKNLRNRYNIENRNNLYFSWVNNIGHQIIKKIELEIGGKVIDYIDKYSFLINQHRHINTYKQDVYNKMIGNIEILTTYDYNLTPKYELIIPLHYWFHKYSGLSIPCVFLRYHDIKINLELENLSKCCYFELDFDDPNVNIQDYIQLNDISLIVNYIFLDDDERKKFGQYQHEYLIEQTQHIQIDNITNNKINFEIPFVNPVKDLHWIVIDNLNSLVNKDLDVFNNIYLPIRGFFNINQINYNMLTTKYTNLSKTFLKIEFDNNITNYLKENMIIKINNSIYYDGEYKILSPTNNYCFINIQYYKNITKSFLFFTFNNSIINNLNIEFNGISRFKSTDGLFFDYVIPSHYYSNSISINGISSYTFSLNPHEFNPSGFFNFNEIKYGTLNILLNNDKIIKNSFWNSTLSIRVYATNYNLLRFYYGRAVLALNI